MVFPQVPGLDQLLNSFYLTLYVQGLHPNLLSMGLAHKQSGVAEEDHQIELRKWFRNRVKFRNFPGSSRTLSQRKCCPNHAERLWDRNLGQSGQSRCFPKRDNWRLEERGLNSQTAAGNWAKECLGLKILTKSEGQLGWAGCKGILWTKVKTNLVLGSIWEEWP